MESDKPILPTDSRKNIEKAIMEHGTIDCPSSNCKDKLISEQKWEQEQGKVIIYKCQNSNCTHHIPRQIFIVNESNQIETTSVETASNKLANNNIFTFIGICLFAILCYTSYHFYSDNQNLDNDLAKTGIPTEQSTYSSKHDPSRVNRKPLHKSEKITANNTIEDSEELNINAFAEQTRTWIAAGNFEKGKLNIKELLENERYKSALLLSANDLTRNQLIELIGYSYGKNKKQFTYNFLQQIPDFEMWKKFIKTYDVEKKYTDVYLGRAYSYLPNKLKTEVSTNEIKKMQLTALVHYLQAAKSNNFAGQKFSSIKAINDLSKAYLIFKYNPTKPNNFKTIETLIESKDTLEIQSRIDFISRIIDGIS